MFWIERRRSAIPRSYIANSGYLLPPFWYVCELFRFLNPSLWCFGNCCRYYVCLTHLQRPLSPLGLFFAVFCSKSFRTCPLNCFLPCFPSLKIEVSKIPEKDFYVLWYYLFRFSKFRHSLPICTQDPSPPRMRFPFCHRGRISKNWFLNDSFGTKRKGSPNFVFIWPEELISLLYKMQWWITHRRFNASTYWWCFGTLTINLSIHLHQILGVSVHQNIILAFYYAKREHYATVGGNFAVTIFGVVLH